jgi:hypothetical protein
MRLTGHVARIEKRRRAYRILVWNPAGNRLPGRPRHRWEHNIKMDLQEVGCEEMEWIDVTEGRSRWFALVTR